MKLRKLPLLLTSICNRQYVYPVSAL
uniref:Uncharacterized protein n=1 Tax=Rhizophora mucronata TaxID=61149 RepID=A0A2P2Q9M3_RHIMU